MTYIRMSRKVLPHDDPAGDATSAATWPAEAAGVVGADQVVALAYLTPASPTPGCAIAVPDA